MPSVYMPPIERDREYGLPRMTEGAIWAQSRAVWHAVERRILGSWPSRVQQMAESYWVQSGRTQAPPGWELQVYYTDTNGQRFSHLKRIWDHNWLSWEMALDLEALDVPIRYLFTACAIEVRDRC